MRTFRGPHPHRLPGMPHDDTSDEEGDEDLVIIQPVFHAVDDSDESEDELNEADRIGLNLHFQPQQHFFLNDVNIDVHDDDDDDDDDNNENEDEDDEEEEEDIENDNDIDSVLEDDEDNSLDEQLPHENGIGENDGEEDVVDLVDQELNELEDVLISTPSPAPMIHIDLDSQDDSDSNMHEEGESTSDIIPDNSDESRNVNGDDPETGADNANDAASVPVEAVSHTSHTQFSKIQEYKNTEESGSSNPSQSQWQHQSQFDNIRMNNLDVEMSRGDDSPPDAMNTSQSPPLSSTSSTLPHQHQLDDGDPVPVPVPKSNPLNAVTAERIPGIEITPTTSPEQDQDADSDRNAVHLNVAQQKIAEEKRDLSDSRSLSGLSDSEHEAMDHQNEDEEDEEEQFCNPMVSSVDDQENEDVLRGDRIGSTTYSERHILKILMNWVEKLPQFAQGISLKTSSSKGSSATSSPAAGQTVDLLDKPLDEELEESMSLLWDMSAETDVMYFLIDNNILLMIRDNLDTANCPTRLKEIALGILANLLSCSSILENFPEKDEHLNLVDRVVMEALTSTAVPLLTQVFAVLRRVVCYIRNAKPLERWMKLFLHQDFIQAANFLLASSTNVILLGDVIMMFFTLMEVLSPPHELEFQDSSDEEKSKYDDTMASNFKPFIESEFVPSICEGLNELLKDPHSRQRHSQLDHDRGEGSGMRNTDPAKLPHCPTTGNGPDADQDDLVVPPGHVQTACLNGLASLSYLQKFSSGKELLRKHHKSIMDVLLSLFGKFRFCTERIEGPDILDYYALAVDLLSLCHVELDRVRPSAITIPISATILLVEEEGKKEKDDNYEHHKTHMVQVTIDIDSDSNNSNIKSATEDTTATASSRTLVTSATRTTGEKTTHSQSQTQSQSQSIEIKSADVSPFTIILYNYLIALEDKFGQKEITEAIRNSGKNKKKLTEFYNMVRQVADKVHRDGGDVNLNDAKNTPT